MYFVFTTWWRLVECGHKLIKDNNFDSPNLFIYIFSSKTSTTD